MKSGEVGPGQDILSGPRLGGQLPPGGDVGLGINRVVEHKSQCWGPRKGTFNWGSQHFLHYLWYRYKINKRFCKKHAEHEREKISLQKNQKNRTRHGDGWVEGGNRVNAGQSNFGWIMGLDSSVERGPDSGHSRPCNRYRSSRGQRKDGEGGSATVMVTRGLAEPSWRPLRPPSLAQAPLLLHVTALHTPPLFGRRKGPPPKGGGGCAVDRDGEKICGNHAGKCGEMRNNYKFKAKTSKSPDCQCVNYWRKSPKKRES